MDGILTYIWIFNIFMVFALNLALWRDMKNPAVFGSFMWLCIIVLHKFVPHGLYQLGPEVLSVVFFSVFVFSAGVMMGQMLTRQTVAEGTSLVSHPNRHIVNLYVMISIVCLPLLVRMAISLASHGITPNFLLNLRIALSNDESPQSFGILSYVTTVAFSAFFLRLADGKKPLASFGVIVPSIVSIFYAFMGTGRAFFFLLLVPAYFITLFTRPVALKIRHVIVFTGLLIAIFVFMGQLLGKVGGEDTAAVDIFSVYLLGGISAFQEVLASSPHLEYGINAFRTIYAILAALGFDIEVPKLVQGYVHIPKPTNVYTVFHPYFLDFGLPFVFVAQFIIGFGHSWLYSLAVRRSTPGIVLYSLSIYPLFMQWFMDQYILLLSLWMQYFILLLIPFAVPRLYCYLKELSAKRETTRAT